MITPITYSTNISKEILDSTLAILYDSFAHHTVSVTQFGDTIGNQAKDQQIQIYRHTLHNRGCKQFLCYIEIDTTTITVDLSVDVVNPIPLLLTVKILYRDFCLQILHLLVNFVIQDNA